ncbi:DUF6783 domain-containing protein [Hungatella effluvii]
MLLFWGVQMAGMNFQTRPRAMNGNLWKKIQMQKAWI